MVAIAVVGGLASITGTVLGGLFVVGLPAFFPGSPEVALLTSGIGLLVLLLYFPGGLVQVLFNARDLAFAALAGRRPEPEPPALRHVPARARRARGAGVPARRRPRARPPCGWRTVSVRFGVRTVVDDAVARGGPGRGRWG